MNKKSIRSFAFGIVFTISFIVAYTMFFEEEQEISVSEAKTILEDEGYITIAQKDYEQLKEENSEEASPEAEAEQKEAEEKNEEQSPDSKQEENTDVIHYQLEIQRGMKTHNISQLLEAANIIENRSDFEKFLIEHNYSKKVQVGTFELNSTMNYDTIGKMITKNE